MDYDQIPRVALLSAVFFVSSLIHLPVGPTSVHLVLNGLIGLLLGWVAFPAIFVGLTLQALLFQFGGITTLGVNTTNIAIPAVICFYLFNHPCRSGAIYFPFLAGFLAILITAILIAAALVTTGEQFSEAAVTIAACHFPVMIIEGILTFFLVGFLRKVKPEILGKPHAANK